jgi:hypothetical protein
VSFNNQDSIDEEIKEPAKTSRRRKKKPSFLFDISGVQGQNKAIHPLVTGRSKKSPKDN